MSYETENRDCGTATKDARGRSNPTLKKKKKKKNSALHISSWYIHQFMFTTLKKNCTHQQDKITYFYRTQSNSYLDKITTLDSPLITSHHVLPYFRNCNLAVFLKCTKLIFYLVCLNSCVLYILFIVFYGLLLPHIGCSVAFDSSREISNEIKSLHTGRTKKTIIRKNERQRETQK